ncbi:helix-turn-helix domain-containing protein [Fulvivirgaceae bacterium BMA12]|uniref:Helix-turn-helix domain-containing protein n=1 Tax=Agaribacillus aureus TaxID=3051825 RepID=A0ABT8L0C3_9BACT|nr:helix-turn-helix domain-containing protein [Fulvivirgaceae bacterium BMA12]
MTEKQLTRLGQYLEKRAVNKSHVARRTGISKQRLSELSIKMNTLLRADELFMIAIAIEAEPCDLLQFVCGHLRDQVK